MSPHPPGEDREILLLKLKTVEPLIQFLEELLSWLELDVLKAAALHPFDPAAQALFLSRAEIRPGEFTPSHSLIDDDLERAARSLGSEFSVKKRRASEEFWDLHLAVVVLNRPGYDAETRGAFVIEFLRAAAAVIRVGLQPVLHLRAQLLDQLAPADLTKSAGGPAPHSVCEARLSVSEYTWLLAWARDVPATHFADDGSSRQEGAGLLLIALLAEWNRRDADGDSVFVGANKLFGAEARSTLFDDNGDPRKKARTAIRAAADGYGLRHAFGPDEETTLRWYLTVQLQYGFCRNQIPRVPNWLRGHPPTEAMQRLLAQSGPLRSRSFQRLISGLRLYDRDSLSAAEARRQLEVNHWVLPEWAPELLESARACAADAPAADEDQRLVERAALCWDTARGPVVELVFAAPAVDPEAFADRYDLRAGAQRLATWLLQPGADTGPGEYRTDVRCAALPAGNPELMLRLEDDTGEAVAAEAVPVWDAAAEVQSLRLGTTPTLESARWEAGREFVVVTRPEHTASQPPDEWFLTGHGTPLARRWLRYASSPKMLVVTDNEGQVVWEAHAVLPPMWAAAAKVSAVPADTPFGLGDRVWFRVSGGPKVRAEWAVANGDTLQSDAPNNRFGPVNLSPEQAVSGYRVRVGLERDAVRATYRGTVRVACRGLAHRPASADEWRSRRAEDRVFGYEARQDAFRVFAGAEEGGVLLEGYEVHGRCGDRPRRLHQLLGTGAPLDLVAAPYNVCAGDRYPLAAGVHDTGIVTGGTHPSVWPDKVRLTLTRSLAPRDGHFVLLWSDRHGLHRIDHQSVTSEDGGRTWSVDPPWADEPQALLAAVGFDHQRLGWWWFEQFERVFSADPHFHAGLSARNRIALIRWLRLPALQPNKFKRPCLEALAHAHPADLLGVGLFDGGLSGLPGGLELRFNRTAADRLAFDAITRQLLLDAPLTAEAAEQVADLFEGPSDPRGHMVERLFPAHPILAARVARLTWLGPRTNRLRLRADVRERRLCLAGVPDPGYRNRLSDLLAGACRTFTENDREAAADGFVEQAMVRPTINLVYHGGGLDPLQRHNLLVALGSGDFRTYLALRLLTELEGRL
jgi:hypothetical protein